MTRALAVSPPRPVRPPLSAARVTLVVALAHGLNDTYAAFLPPLLPRIMGRLGLSIALAATLTMVYSVASAVLQPLAGHLADRYGRRAFVVVGPVLSGVFLSLVGWAPTFALLVTLLILGGLGSAAFHPPGASFAVRIQEGGRSGVRFSVFSFGGAAGFALGPMVAVGIVAWRGLDGLAVAMVPTLVLAPLLWKLLPSGRSERRPAPPPHPGKVVRMLAGPLGLVFGISALAAFTQRVYVTMMPIIAASDGRSEAVGAIALSVYFAGQAVGTFAGGYLTDRMDRSLLLAGLTALSLPLHVLALGGSAGSGMALAAAFGAGMVNMAALPPVVVLAQELLPDGAAVGSGIVMGLAWASGSMLLLGTGVLGDLLGARPAALASLPLLLIATALAVHPTLRRHTKRQPI